MLQITRIPSLKQPKFITIGIEAGNWNVFSGYALFNQYPFSCAVDALALFGTSKPMTIGVGVTCAAIFICIFIAANGYLVELCSDYFA